MLESTFRPGQLEAVKTILARLQAGAKTTAIVLPTRYGKADVIRVTSVISWLDGYAGLSLALSPNELLRDQLAHEKRWNDALSRYQISGHSARITRLETLPKYFPGGGITFAPNGEMFVSSTIQLVARSIDLFAAWAEHVLHRTGKPLLVHVDECHMVGADQKAWGLVVEALLSAGAHVVLYTATAVRSDGLKIPGFAWEQIGIAEPITVVKRGAGSVPEKVKISIYDGQKYAIKLIADAETTFEAAWAERPSPLCKVSRVPFDVELSRLQGGSRITGGELLSELFSTAETKTALGRVARSQQVVHDGAARFVVELKRMRQVGPDIAGLIFCCNDDASSATMNRHAGQIRAEIERIAPELRVVIATSADANDQGKQHMEAFAAGAGDVLIVKQMAGMGWDVPRLKVALDLSPVRTVAACIQRWMRIATPYGVIRHGVLITPDDLIGRTIWREMIEASGGQASASDLEFRESYERDRREESEAASFGIDGTAGADFEDSDANRAAKDKLAAVDLLLDEFPILESAYSHAELATKADALGLTGRVFVNSDNLITDSSYEVEILHVDINRLAHDIASTLTKDRPRDAWVDTLKLVYRRVKSESGISPGRELGDIVDIATLQKLKAICEQELCRVESARWS